MSEDQIPFLAGGVGIVLIVVLFFVFLCIASIFLHIGAGMANIANRTFGKAILGTLATSVLGSILSAILPLLGTLIALFVNPLLIMAVYSTGYGKSLLAYILSLVVSMLVTVGVFFLLGTLGVAGSATGG